MTPGTESDANRRTPRQSKVARVIHDYDLNRMEDELVALWTGEGDERLSLRDLAEYLNQAILRAAMADAGMNILDGEVENTHRLLTADEVSSGTRVEAKTTLEREGIDVDQLTQDFVSHQAIYTYLTEHRDIDGPSDTTERDRLERTIDTVQRLKSRLGAVAEKGVQNLSNAGQLSLGEFTVFVDVRILCEDCGTQSDLIELLRNGGCTCDK